MKLLKFLQFIFKLCYWLSILTLVVYSALIIAYYQGYLDEDKINWSVPATSFMLVVTVILYFIIILLFILILKKFLELVELFYQKSFFDKRTPVIFKHIGILIIISALSSRLLGIINFIYGSTTISPTPTTVITYEINIGIDSFLFLISIGLFFIALSRIFKNAIALREENELTI